MDQVIQAAWFWVFFVLATVLVIGWALSIKAPRDNPHRMTPEEVAQAVVALCVEHGVVAEERGNDEPGISFRRTLRDRRVAATWHSGTEVDMDDPLTEAEIEDYRKHREWLRGFGVVRHYEPPDPAAWRISGEELADLRASRFRALESSRRPRGASA